MPRLKQDVTMVEVALDAARSFVTGPLGEFASKLIRLFRLTAPAAPGLVFVGGEIDPTRVDGVLAEPGTLSLAGAETAMDQALAACLGEGVERPPSDFAAEVGAQLKS